MWNAMRPVEKLDQGEEPERLAATQLLKDTVNLITVLEVLGPLN
jgi:hypothetical protein